jgi:hypothetical protein
VKNAGLGEVVLCLTEHSAVKTYLGVEPHAFLTSTLDGGEWLASQSGRFIPKERAPGTIGGWMGLRSGLDAVAKR